MTSSTEFVGSSSWPASWLGSTRDERETFIKARELTLNLIQWLARVANSYAANGPTESNLALDFAPDGSFVTKTFDRDIALELRLPTLELQFKERGKRVPHVLDPEERSPAEVEAWILVELLHRGVNRDKFSKSLPYAIANLMTGDAEDYSPRSCGSGLTELTTWLSAASLVLSKRGRIVCLPQTLTLAVPGPSGAPVVGFSPGDAECNEPFFFVVSSVKRTVLTASELSAEKQPAVAAAEFINAPSDAMRA
jgi:hypothetical protein